MECIFALFVVALFGKILVLIGCISNFIVIQKHMKNKNTVVRMSFQLATLQAVECQWTLNTGLSKPYFRSWFLTFQFEEESYYMIFFIKAIPL